MDKRCPPKLLYPTILSCTGERKHNDRLVGQDKDRQIIIHQLLLDKTDLNRGN